MASFLMRTADVMARNGVIAPPFLEDGTAPEPGDDPAREPAPDPEPTPAPDPDPTPAPSPGPSVGSCEAPPLLRDESGTIATAGATTDYTLELEEGQRVSFGHQGPRGSIPWQLTGPAALGELFDNWQYQDTVQEIERTGTYTLTLYGQGTNTGEYSFRIHDVTDTPAE